MRIVRFSALSTAVSHPEVELCSWEFKQIAVFHIGERYKDCWDLVIEAPRSLSSVPARCVIRNIDPTHPLGSEVQKYGDASARKKVHRRFINNALDAISLGIPALTKCYRDAAVQGRISGALELALFIVEFKVGFPEPRLSMLLMTLEFHYC